VEHVLELLEKEMRVAMALTGCRSISDIGGDVLEH
jgi:isopentenyl diphosphate isomerase/L-lactate dehydrogenase-like FMN-dependent dehydrogenase